MLDQSQQVIIDFDHWLASLIAPRKIKPDDHERPKEKTPVITDDWEE
jgi:hypothetical protein